jgi:hypothetical protein
MVGEGRSFDREEHRTSAYALNQNESLDPNFELISQLLDKTIVESPSQRLSSAVDLFYEVEQLIEVMEAHGNAVGLDSPQRCIFCTRGQYRVVIDSVNDGMNDSKMLAQAQLGLALTQSHIRMIVMVCDYCGNMQTFRPDLPQSRRGSGVDGAKQETRVERWKKRG